MTICPFTPEFRMTDPTTTRPRRSLLNRCMKEWSLTVLLTPIKNFGPAETTRAGSAITCERSQKPNTVLISACKLRGGGKLVNLVQLSDAVHLHRAPTI